MSDFVDNLAFIPYLALLLTLNPVNGCDIGFYNVADMFRNVKRQKGKKYIMHYINYHTTLISLNTPKSCKV